MVSWNRGELKIKVSLTNIIRFRLMYREAVIDLLWRSVFVEDIACSVAASELWGCFWLPAASTHFFLIWPPTLRRHPTGSPVNIQLRWYSRKFLRWEFEDKVVRNWSNSFASKHREDLFWILRSDLKLNFFRVFFFAKKQQSFWSVILLLIICQISFKLFNSIFWEIKKTVSLCCY